MLSWFNQLKEVHQLKSILFNKDVIFVLRKFEVHTYKVYVFLLIEWLIFFELMRLQKVILWLFNTFSNQGIFSF
jgi:hypothetical protein